jgi:hypothetical protein
MMEAIMKSRSLSLFILLGVISMLAPALVLGQALTGDYVIGAGQTYTTLGAAITALNTNGASGTVRFLIDGDLTEPGSLEITTVTLNGTNRLVIKPNTGKTPTVTFTSCATSGNKGNAGLTLSGTSTNVGYVTIDGSNTNGGTTRDMTFALSDATNGRYCLRLNFETDNVTIKNLKITAVNIKPTTASASRTYGIYAPASSTAAADSLTILNCEIGTSTSAFYYGIYKPDGGTFPYGAALNVSKNRIYAQHKGMSIWGSSGTSAINDNTVSVIGHSTGVYVQNSVNGIYAESWLGTLNIFNNRIVSLRAKAVSQTSLKALYGILVYYASGSGNIGQTANVYNNFISDFIYAGDASTVPSEINGIAVDALDQTVNVSYNTIYINADSISLNPTYGIRVYDDVGLAAYVKNNIVVNAVNHDSAYAIYCNPIVNTTLKASDYNDLFVVGANANIGNYNATKAKTLANWRTASSQDAHSINVNPASPFGAARQLTSLTDLHWFSAPLNVFAGTPITGITTDIDGETRNASTPYMGADEAGPFTGIGEDGMQPNQFALGQNYPNPFNPETGIRYQVSGTSEVDLRVYDLLGREVAVLVNAEKMPGTYTATWNADGMAGGIYFYQLRAGGNTYTKKMVLLR